MSGFEGSFLGQTDRIDGNTALECGVCWAVYDPQMGDPVWQIPAGTAFSDLPEHWRCPHCDAGQEQFMVLDSAAGVAENRNVHRPAKSGPSLHGRLVEAVKAVAARMSDLPVYRDDLPLGVLGPQTCDAGSVAIVYTPWSMYLLLLADDAERLIEGTERTVDLPSGSYPFVRGHLDGIGAVENCSLFSPMEEFGGGDAVMAVARAAFRALFESPQPPQHDKSAEKMASPSRREFLTGRSAGV